MQFLISLIADSDPDYYGNSKSLKPSKHFGQPYASTDLCGGSGSMVRHREAFHLNINTRMNAQGRYLLFFTTDSCKQAVTGTLIQLNRKLLPIEVCLNDSLRLGASIFNPRGRVVITSFAGFYMCSARRGRASAIKL